MSNTQKLIDNFKIYKSHESSIDFKTKKDVYDKKLQETTATIATNIAKTISRHQNRLDTLGDIGSLQFTSKVYQYTKEPFEDEACNCCVIL